MTEAAGTDLRHRVRTIGILLIVAGVVGAVIFTQMKKSAEGEALSLGFESALHLDAGAGFLSDMTMSDAERAQSKADLYGILSTVSILALPALGGIAMYLAGGGRQQTLTESAEPLPFEDQRDAASADGDDTPIEGSHASSTTGKPLSVERQTPDQ